MIYKFVSADFIGSVADFLRYKGVSSRQITRLRKEQGLIKLNGRTAFTDASVRRGDEVEIEIKEGGIKVPPFDIALNFVYEDNYFCVIDKPVGLAVIPTRAHYGKSLANALAARWGEDFVFHPVTRLDKDTSGLVIVAKDSLVHERFDAMLRRGQMQKKYLAVISGGQVGGGKIDAPVYRPDGQTARVVSPLGKNALTVYKIVKTFDENALAEVQLFTGRTHQIRLHMSYIGRPLCGDSLYGGDTRFIDRQALHCAELKFVHPVTGEGMAFESPLPDDMVRLIRRLGGTI